MRVISAAQEAVLVAGSKARAEFCRVFVVDYYSNAQCLNTYAGVDLVESVDIDESADGPGMTLDLKLKREAGLKMSLAPFIEDSPLNKKFDPAATYHPLLALNRAVYVEHALMPVGIQPAAGDWCECFRGRIEKIDSASGPSVQVNCLDQIGRLKKYIKQERLHALASPYANPVRVWEANAVFDDSSYIVPSKEKRNGHYYSCDVGGTTGATEPTWTTGGASVADGTIGGSGWTEVGATSGAGFSVETVIQQLLDAELGGVTLYVPTSPSFTINPFVQASMSILSALQALALAIGGWDIRFKWKVASSAYVLTLWCPDRTGGTVARTISQSEIAPIERLAQDIEKIRNDVEVTYDAEDESLDPTGNPYRRTIGNTVTAAITASRTAYDNQWMGLGEGTLSPVNSAAKALALANACASDLCEPVADQAVPFVFGFLFVELGDVYTFSANSKLYSSSQSFAVYGYHHTFKGGYWKTAFLTRGKPGIGTKTWHKAGANHARGREANGKIVPGNTAAPTITASQVVGGFRLRVEEVPWRHSLLIEREFHKSQSSGFAPSSATLFAEGPQHEVVIPDLTPGETWFVKTVPKIRTLGPGGVPRIVRGEPSVEATIVAGYLEPRHMNPRTFAGPYPLNGGFEAPGVAGVVPEHWTVKTGAIPTDLTFNDSAQYTGAISGIVLGTTMATELYSAMFPCEPSTSKKLHVWMLRVGSAEASRTVTLTLSWRDASGAEVATSTTTVNVAGLSTTVWADQVLTATSHSGARWCVVDIMKTTTNADYSFRFDKVWVE